MIKIITDIKDGEPDILTPYQDEDLVLKNYADQELFRMNPPIDGWTTETLAGACDKYCYTIKWTPADIIEAYVGEQWVGSTEV